MTISAWRIVKARHAPTAFSGEGAYRHGGRWNSPGVAVIYAAGSISLAMLEMLVHLRRPDLLKSYVLYELRFDAALLTGVDLSKLPRSWRKSPPPPAIQAIGNAWVAAGASAVLRVPSRIVPNESNYLLNPAQADFAGIAIGRKQPLKFGPRFIK